MKRNIGLWLIFLVLSMWSIVSASDWVSIGLDGQGNNWLIDQGSILRDNNIIKAWKRIEFKEPQPYPPTGEPIKSALFLEVTDCSKRLTGVKASKLLRVDGSVIAPHEDPDAKIQWQSVAPDTQVEKSMNFVCSSSTSTK